METLTIKDSAIMDGYNSHWINIVTNSWQRCAWMIPNIWRPISSTLSKVEVGNAHRICAFLLSIGGLVATRGHLLAVTVSTKREIHSNCSIIQWISSLKEIISYGICSSGLYTTTIACIDISVSLGSLTPGESDVYHNVSTLISGIVIRKQ